MERRCKNDRGGDKVYPAIFGDEEKNGLKLDDNDNDAISYQHLKSVSAVRFWPDGRSLETSAQKAIF